MGLITIDLRSRKLIYEQIVDNVKEQVFREVIRENDYLPSVRSLANELGINPNTIARAISELEREGLIYTIAGKGAFVEEDLTLISLKRKTEVLEHFSKALFELKNAEVELEEAIKKVNEVYGKDNL